MTDTAQHPDDAGMSLVEVIVVLFVSALFLGLLGTFLIQGLQAQAQATERDRATGASSVVTDSITLAVRNSDLIKVSADGSSLIARVASGASGWECRAWAVRDGELRYRAGTAAPNLAAAGSWASLAQARGNLADGTAFAADGTRGVRVGLAVTSGDTTITLTAAATAQAVGTGGSPCW